MVAGGIGQTPFLALAQEALGQQAFGQPPRSNRYAQRVSFCYGVTLCRLSGRARSVRTSRRQCPYRYRRWFYRCLPAARSLGPLEKLLLEEDGQTPRVVVCGPEPMMEAVSKLCLKYEVPCEVSLETPMACGIGICFTCVAKIGCEHDWDYKRTCVEGPIFDAKDVVW